MTNAEWAIKNVKEVKFYDKITNKLLWAEDIMPVENNILNNYPNCGSKLHWTYDINREAKDGEDPRIYGVVCTDYNYEN